MSTFSPTPLKGFPFLSLPVELRLDIYERFLYTHHHGDIDDDTVVVPWVGWEAVKLLEVCKQIYEEASPIIYEKMTISCNLEEWRIFLERIGPRNVSKIRDLTITYSCSPDDNLSKCFGSPREKFDIWREILGNFKISQSHSSLRTMTVNICPCQGHPWHVEEYGPLSADNFKYTACQVYKDLSFLQHLSHFSGIRQMVVRGRFDPLWGMFLRKKLGFIVKRSPGGDLELLNSTHPHYNGDLKGYRPSKLLDGFYDEVIEDPKTEESETKEYESDTWNPFSTYTTDYVDPLAHEW
ncbi:hypothetical protein F4781DRAFT_440701 [Annulohypoxylon bovei var. microspora]|nr:hypothetical protein F4781DRAFT_440701 [Annulohypoxylon bovei var. microspora]